MQHRLLVAASPSRAKPILVPEEVQLEVVSALRFARLDDELREEVKLLTRLAAALLRDLLRKLKARERGEGRRSMQFPERNKKFGRATLHTAAAPLEMFLAKVGDRGSKDEGAAPPPLPAAPPPLTPVGATVSN